MPRVGFKKIFGYLGLTGFQLDALLLTSLQKLHRFNIRFVQRMVGFRMQFPKNIQGSKSGVISSVWIRSMFQKKHNEVESLCVRSPDERRDSRRLRHIQAGIILEEQLNVGCPAGEDRRINWRLQSEIA